MLFVLARTEGRAARFVIGAIWLRYVMAVFNDVTFEPIVAGFSPIALATCGLFVLGLFIVPPRRWLLKGMAPVYLMIGAVVLSGLVNGLYTDLFSAAIKWGFFCVILLCAYEAATKLGEARSAAVFLWAFLPPLIFQWLSIATGTAKLDDDGSSYVYIGGYNHESAFSIVMMTGLCMAAFAMQLKPVFRGTLIFIFLVGLYLAGYRTTIVAVAPVIIVYLTVEAAGWFRARERLAVGLAMAIVVLVAAGAVAFALQSRFTDFAEIGQADVLGSPSAFTAEQRGLLSGRAYLWSQYLDAYARGGLAHHAFGFGPESWAERFHFYAHNTFVSTLFELGAVGAAALIYLWLAMLLRSLRVEDKLLRYKLVAAHVGVILVNMATMGQWLIEGLILYALVCALTLALARAPVHAPAAAEVRRARAASRRYASAHWSLRTRDRRTQ
jgi:hypothetical protein